MGQKPPPNIPFEPVGAFLNNNSTHLASMAQLGVANCILCVLHFMNQGTPPAILFVYKSRIRSWKTLTRSIPTARDKSPWYWPTWWISCSKLSSFLRLVYTRSGCCIFLDCLMLFYLCINRSQNQLVAFKLNLVKKEKCVINKNDNIHKNEEIRWSDKYWQI